MSAGDVGALEKKGKKNEGDRQRRKDATTVASAGDPGALATHREDRKRKAVQRTLRNIDSFHIGDIFQMYRQVEDLTATDRADYEASDEPREWKMVVTYSQYMACAPWPKTSSFSSAFHQL